MVEVTAYNVGPSVCGLVCAPGGISDLDRFYSLVRKYQKSDCPSLCRDEAIARFDSHIRDYVRSVSPLSLFHRTIFDSH